MNIKIIYNRRKKLDASGCGYIDLSISHNKKRVFKTTGLKVKPNQFNLTTFKVVNHPQAALMNATISQLLATYQQREVELIAKLKNYTVYDIVEPSEQQERPISFLAFARHEAEDRRTGYKSKNLYNKVLELIEEFAGRNFGFDKITLKFVRDFDKFLFSKGYHPNSVAKRHTMLKMFIMAAIRDGYMEVRDNPYHNFQIKKVPTERKSLEKEQFAMLETLEVPEVVQETKDMFLFSCYTGLRYSDMIRVAKSDIVRSGDGVYLNMREQKTKKLKINIPLHKLFEGKAVAILDKYISNRRELVFPSYTDQYLNRMLKIIGMLLKLNFPLTFHCSRHTFGTMLAEKTQDPYLIKELMNHADLKTSMIYIHSSKARIEKSLSNVDWSLA